MWSSHFCASEIKICIHTIYSVYELWKLYKTTFENISLYLDCWGYEYKNIYHASLWFLWSTKNDNFKPYSAWFCINQGFHFFAFLFSSIKYLQVVNVIQVCILRSLCFISFRCVYVKSLILITMYFSRYWLF